MKCAASTVEIEHRDGDGTVVIRINCRTAYEAAILYDQLNEDAKSGGLTIDIEGIKVRK